MYLPSGGQKPVASTKRLEGLLEKQGLPHANNEKPQEWEKRDPIRTLSCALSEGMRVSLFGDVLVCQLRDKQQSMREQLLSIWRLLCCCKYR